MDLYYKNNQTSVYSNVTEWSPLNCVLLMDEDFENYIYLANWMRAFNGDDDVYSENDDWHNIVKDIKLHILSGNKKALLVYTFVGAFPTMLGDVMFDSSAMDPTQIQFNVEFRYQYFTWEKTTL